MFTWFDQDGDGWLTRDDFERMAEMFKALADDDDEANKSAMENAFMHWWDIMLAAADGTAGERIGGQEFIAIIGRAGPLPRPGRVGLASAPG